MALMRVPINSASADEISNLYDISLRRAQQIVDYRNANGPFREPADLAKVQEISPKLALFLAPHIDWRLPEQPELPKQRSWDGAIFWLVILLCMLSSTLLLLILVIAAVRQGAILDPLKTIGAASGIAALFCFTLFVALRFAVSLTRQPARARQLARAGLGSIAVALLVFIPILLMSAASLWIKAGKIQNSSETLQLLLSPPSGGFALFLLYLLMLPQLAVWWRPQLAESRLLARIFDSAFLIAGLALIWALRLQIEGLPLWFLLLAALAGGVIIIVAILSVRRGESFFRTALDFMDVRQHLSEVKDKEHWRFWVNKQLPNPSEQRLLQSALNDMHRASSGQNILLTLVIGAGWWLLETAVGAIVEYYVQGNWVNWFK